MRKCGFLHQPLSGVISEGILWYIIHARYIAQFITHCLHSGNIVMDKSSCMSLRLPVVLALLLAPFVAIMPMLALSDEPNGFEALNGARDIVTATISNGTYTLTASLTGDAVQIINITDPANPSPVAALFDGQDGFVLTDVSDIAIVADGDKTYALTASLGANSTQVIDITDPASPSPVAAMVDGQDGFDLGGPSDITLLTTLDKTYALVANLLGNSIQVIDITDPASPSPVAAMVDGQDGFDALGGVRSIGLAEISGTIYALGAGWSDDAVQIIDVADPASPSPVASAFDGQGGFALAAVDSIDTAAISDGVYALVTSTSDGAVQIINVTDPANPSPVASVFDGDARPSHPGASSPTPGILDDQGNFTLNGAGDIVAYGIGGHSYAIVASPGDDAVRIIDVTDPTNPLPAAVLFDGQGGFNALGGAHGVALAVIGERTYALVAASDDGAVQIIDVTDTISLLPTASVFDDESSLGDAGPLIIGGVDLSQASPRLGSADASVTIIEFGDYQCPRCKSWFDNTKPQIDSNYIDTGVANLYFVDVKYLGGDSHTAAIATYCAQDQGMYWEYHDTLYENQKGLHSGWASASNLVGFAEDIGLDTAEFEACLQSSEQRKRLDFNAEQGAAHGVFGTPHFIIVGPGGSVPIGGPQPYGPFEATVQKLLN